MRPFNSKNLLFTQFSAIGNKTIKSHPKLLRMKSKLKLGFAISAFIISGCVTTSPSLTAETDISDFYEKAAPNENSSKAIEFTFTAFGDSGWAKTHTSRPIYGGGFKQAFKRFDPNKTTLGDINYINWETSIGTHCEQFWSKLSPSTYAFLTHPKELEDTIDLGFNVIGLANNHTFDCLRSKEGNGPLQTYNFVKSIRSQNPNIALSGVYEQRFQEPIQSNIKTKQGIVPITFASAYVGGSQSHCANMLCVLNLGAIKKSFTDTSRLRILALHSWDKATHARLKAVLTTMLQENMIDIGIGSGPHIKEQIKIVKTSQGNKILATSLGNFIHPSLSAQAKNVALQSIWSFNEQTKTFKLLEANGIKISCDGGECVNKGKQRVF